MSPDSADTHGSDAAAIESIHFLSTPYELQVGEELPVSIEVTYSDGTTLVDPSATEWSIADESIASVDASRRRLVAASPGETTLTASFDGFSANTRVRVSAAPALNIVADEVLLAPTGQKQLDIEVTGSDGEVVDEPDVAWETSSPRDVGVDDGLVRAVSLGEATITATWQGAEDTVEVRVELVDRIEILPDTSSIFAGERLQLGLEYLNESGEELVADEEVTWTSEDVEIAAIDGSGMLAGERGGRVTIHAESAGEETSREFAVDVRFEQLKCHEEFCCALSEHGYLYCFGNNVHAQMASNSYTTTNWLRRVDGDVGLETFDISYTHGCGLNKEGQAFCWGADWSGSLGYETDDTHDSQGYVTGVSFEIKPVDTTLRFQQIKPQFHATFGLTHAGELYVWGHWPAGYQYVYPIPEPDYVRPSLYDEGPWDAIAETRDNILCLKRGTSYWCMGDNEHDEIGLGENADVVVTTLTEWQADSPMASLRGGYDAVCGLDTNQQVWCSGYNAQGVMGKPFDPRAEKSRDTLSNFTPQRTSWADKFDELRAGEGEFFCGIRNGDVWCWGHNGNCQLGWDPGWDYDNPDHVESHSHTPVEMDFLPDNWVDISLGSWAGCLLDSQGQIWCWGLNDVAPYSLSSNEGLDCDPSLRRVFPYEAP